LFKRLPGHPASSAKTVSFSFNCQPMQATEGDTVASALLMNNITTFGHRTNADKAPYCMMGACYECLVEIDGRSMQACMVKVTEGLQVTIQQTDASQPAPSAGTPPTPGDNNT